MRSVKAGPGVPDLVAFMDYLAARWSDEREYEDFAEYVAVARKRVERNGGTFVSLGRRMTLRYRDEANVLHEIAVKGQRIEHRQFS